MDGTGLAPGAAAAGALDGRAGAAPVLRGAAACDFTAFGPVVGRAVGAGVGPPLLVWLATAPARAAVAAARVVEVVEMAAFGPPMTLLAREAMVVGPSRSPRAGF
ncbi:MAG: hypothetical protein ABIS47_09200 [Acidimicrobiales bacterium]